MARRRAATAARSPVLAVALAIALAAGGCAAGLERAAPPVDSLLAYSGQAATPDLARLARGREVYLDQCARCHRPLAIDRYSPERWAAIMPDMVARTKLESQRAADVDAYVRAVLMAGRRE